MRKISVNELIFLVLIIIYIIGQIFIGTRHPVDKTIGFDSPADVDFLYYGAIANQLLNDFPPQNPAFAGEKLTQPFIQYYPATLLARIVNPFNTIRILNVLWLILFGFLLRRYFPDRYGYMAAVIFSSAMIFTQFNALGIDLIARGFTHAPFFILITIALFSKNRTCRLTSIFLAPLINGYMMLMIGPALFIMWLIDRDREQLYTVGAALCGMIAASVLITSGVSSKPFYFIFTESFYFDPWEYLLHATPFILFAIIYRNLKATIILAIAILFGSLVHYNPFFPVFVIYFAGALTFSKIKISTNKRFLIPVTAILFIFFLYSSYEKYNPDKYNYYPRADSLQTNAIDWIKNNTEKSDVFAALTADANQLALVMLDRPTYLGYVGHVSHLGIDWRERYNKLISLYGTGRKISGVDYIYYGPVERALFPMASLRFPIVYSDANVTIYKPE